MEDFHDFNGLFMPFALCNMATGLIVGVFGGPTQHGSDNLVESLIAVSGAS